VPEESQTKALLSSLGPVSGFCLGQAQCLWPSWQDKRLAAVFAGVGLAGIMINVGITLRPQLHRARRTVAHTTGYLSRLAPVDLLAWTVLFLALSLSVYAVMLPKPISAFSHIVGEGTAPPAGGNYHVGDEWRNSVPEAGGSTGWVCVKAPKLEPGQECEWVPSGSLSLLP
jgi:hypothetical protein